MSQDRSIRVIALTRAISEVYRVTLNPYATNESLDNTARDLHGAINNILDSEYRQGFMDASTIALAAMKSPEVF